MYREKIKVLDCTIRDGGLINNHDFDLDFVRAVYRAISEANVDYMEIGYRNSERLFSNKEFGAWKFCRDEDILRAIDGIPSKVKISIMVDVGRVDMGDVKRRDESPVHMIRTATYAKDIDKAINMANQFHDLGYETTINIMAISRDMGPELDDIFKQIERECKVDIVYVVDSFGTLYQETVENLVKRARRYMKTKEIGFHGHNNQQLAFSNTIEAIIHEANYLDASVYGLGRAAGNCPLELLLGFLKNPKFDIRPIYDLISEVFLPFREKIEWGYIIPFAITGMLNEHPRAAMALRKTEDRDSYRKFYESQLNIGLE